MAPRVSVVIPHHGRCDLLHRALASVRAQSLTDWEAFVIDDASPEPVAPVVAALDDPRITSVRLDPGRGAGAARNQGIARAGAPVVAFLDSDDAWEPSKLARQVAVMDALGPEVGLVYTAVTVAETGRQLQASLPGGALFKALLVENVIGTTSSPMVRTALLRQINGFDESLPSCQDWDLYLRLAPLTLMAAVPQRLTLYSNHQTGITGNSAASVIGHRRVEAAFAAEAKAHLPASDQVRRSCRFGEIYLHKRASGAALAAFGRAMRASPLGGSWATARLLGTLARRAAGRRLARIVA